MTDTELKRSLIARINQIQDPAFLKALMVITDGHNGAPSKRYSWGEPSARNWLERKPSQDHTNENFFEDMEQLLRDNNLSQERQS
jgi:hypothetical protein